ncbi:MAG: stage III sporulation protein AB [Eubacteriales bacterium]|nr:stage III sporulation protein AB [Eubacteriales bacterium]
MLKLAGAILCLTGGLLTGISIYTESRKRLECLRMLIMALEIMHSELATNLAPLPVLMKKVSEGTNGCVKELAEELAERTGELKKAGFEELWRESVQKRLSLLDRKSMQRILHLGRILGRAELSEQLSAIRTAEECLALKAAETESSLPEVRKMSVGLSLAAGTLVTIVFL